MRLLGVHLIVKSTVQRKFGVYSKSSKKQYCTQRFLFSVLLWDLNYGNSTFQGVHEKLKPFLCSLCTTSFSKKSTLKMHIRSVHDKLRPFACDQCDAKFSQVSPCSILSWSSFRLIHTSAVFLLQKNRKFPISVLTQSYFLKYFYIFHFQTSSL